MGCRHRVRLARPAGFLKWEWSATCEYPFAWVQVPRREDSRSVVYTFDPRRSLRPRMITEFNHPLHKQYDSFHTSVRNVLRVLENRVYIMPDEAQCSWAPTARQARAIKKIRWRVARRLSHLEVWDRQRCLEKFATFPPAKRDKYVAALDVPFEPHKHGKLGMFVKYESVEHKPSKGYRPRAIFFRQPEFLAAMTRWYAPLEGAICHQKSLWNSQSHVIVKGLNTHDRIRLVHQFVGELGDCVVISCDGKAFDAHVCEGALREEWAFYRAVGKCAGWGKEIRREMRSMEHQQINNRFRCYAQDGIVKGRIKGNRMSGDRNTGAGNCIICVLFVLSYFEDAGIPDRKYRLIDDGDDFFILATKDISKRVERELPIWMSTLNQETEVLSGGRVTQDSMEAIEFCQARPVWCANGYRFIRDPVRVTNVYMRSARWYNTLADAEMYWSAISQAELMINRGVPILYAFFQALNRHSNGAKPCNSQLRRFYLKSALESEVLLDNMELTDTISDDTRLSFAKAFGITPAEQQLVEAFWESWTPGCEWARR